jgi:hypothetical protein
MNLNVDIQRQQPQEIQGLSELADQNNTLNSSSSGDYRKSVQKNLS